MTADYGRVAVRIRDEATAGWNDKAAADRLTDAGGRLVRGHGRVIGRRTVQVGDHCFEARRAVVLNTGTAPPVPSIPGLAGTPFWTNREAVQAEAVPESLVVLGGGAVGVELGQAFLRFGARVHVVEVADRLLPLEEPEASALVTHALAREGMSCTRGHLPSG